jgi:hypothetical protein
MGRSFTYAPLTYRVGLRLVLDHGEAGVVTPRPGSAYGGYIRAIFFAGCFEAEFPRAVIGLLALVSIEKCLRVLLG